jgi:bifunctional non-homologous end joining protein LigD
MKPGDLLKDYKAKRHFARTQEPAGAVGPAGTGGGRFVVQKHDATRLHYDFRLELDGVLKSWAVTKGPSANPADKRLAVRVEDHPLDYGKFEGTIPEGEYGGGTVMLWDEGTWEPLGDPHEGLDSGDLKFTLKGKRLKGEWVLVHMKGRDQKTRKGQRENWLLIKHRDRHASEAGALTDRFSTSVETGRDLDGIAKGLKSRHKAKAGKAAEDKQPAADAQVWSRGKAVALPQFRPPQLATLVDEVPAGRQWLFEMKFDGYRCLAAIAGPQVRLYTRNGNDWTPQFHRLVAPLSRLTEGSALIDGEICAFRDGRTDFSTLKDALSDGGPLVYFAFDLLELDGQSLEKLPLVERKQKLRALLGQIQGDAEVQYSEHVEGNGEKVFAAMCEAGHEGVVAKLAASPYAHERSRSWLKVKCLNRQEFVIAGWRPSQKKRTFASLLLGTWEDGKLIYRGRVGTGFNEASAAKLQAELDRLAADQPAFDAVPRDIRRQARWITPELVGEVAYTEITPDGVLRHPSFLGMRQDKPAAEVRHETPVAARSGKSTATPAAAASAADLSDAAGIAAAAALGVRLTHPERIVFPGQGVTKGNIAAYYQAVAGAMLPHLVNRPLSLVRCPQGRSKHCFFQKHASGGFPGDLKQVPITEKDGSTEDYMYVDTLAGVIAGVQMNTLEFHIWGSRIDRLEKPDRIIFDIDPDEGLSFGDVRQAALDIRDRLAEMGLETFPMVTGGKGIHVIAPLTARTEWPEVKAFCRAFADRLATDEPERFTANIRKVNRKGRMFIDYLRNERGSTAIAPYSTRSRDGAPCAVPVGWNEVAQLDRANGFSLAEAAARAAGPDPWPDYFDLRQSITKSLLASVGLS